MKDNKDFKLDTFEIISKSLSETNDGQNPLI